MKNKKILIVSHQFLPLSSPRTTRWKQIVDELVERGNEVTILSGTAPDNSLKNYRVLFFGNKIITTTISNARNASNQKSNNYFKNLILNIAKVMYRLVFKLFSWPDYAMFWIFTVFKNREDIDDNYDVIFSVSLPFTSHICAYILNKRMNAEWIVDVGDPFTLKTSAFENNKFLYAYLNKYFENKIYKLCSKIIFTHKEAADIHVKQFNIDTEKVIIGLPVSFSRLENVKKSNQFTYDSEPLNIGYFGVFTDKVREPDNYIKASKNFLLHNSIHHWFINSSSQKYFENLNINDGLNIVNDFIPKDSALEIMITKMHILLSIGNFNNIQLPSKTIEYISLGKPVIHFAEISSDPLYEIENKFKNLKIINSRTSSEEFDEFLEFIRSGMHQIDPDEFNKIFSPSAIVDKLY